MNTSPGRKTPVTIDPDPPDATGDDSVYRVLAAVAAWTVLAVLALIAFGRLVHLDDAIGWPYPTLDAFTPLLYLPAYAALAVGFALRRNLLLVAAVVLIGVHLFWTLPEVWPGSPPTAPAGAARFRLLTAEVGAGHLDAGELGDQIRSGRPDVVVLTGLTGSTRTALRADGALAGYRYQTDGVFARLPLTAAHTTTVAGMPITRLTATLAGGKAITLFAVRTTAPSSRPATGRWRAQLADLRREATAVTGPVVLAGDFAATRDNRPFGRLTGAGLRDAHDAAGVGWAPTWNASSGLLPPTVRFDHVLVSKAFTVTGYRTGAGDGADHRPLSVDLALTP